MFPGALATEQGTMDFVEQVAFIFRVLTFQLVKI